MMNLEKRIKTKCINLENVKKLKINICSNCNKCCERKYCSPECYNNYRKYNKPEKKNQFYRCSKKCDWCNNWFETRIDNNSHKFKAYSCSRSCQTSLMNKKRSKEQIFSKNCLICNEEYETSRISQMYCSKSCQVISNNKGRKRKTKKKKVKFKNIRTNRTYACSTRCIVCEKWFETRYNNNDNSKIKNTCSRDCRDMKRRKRFECYTKCYNCEKWFHNSYDTTEQKLFHIFCSAECSLIKNLNYDPDKKEKLTIFNCFLCNKEIIVKNNPRPRKFCNKSCSMKYNNKVKNSASLGVQSRCYKNPSSIEKIFEEILKKNNINYVRQKRLSVINHPYDYLIFPNILIELDGDYYHNPKFFPKTHHRDRECEKFAEEHRYILYRFSENNINKDIKLVEKQILEILT